MKMYGYVSGDAAAEGKSKTQSVRFGYIVGRRLRDAGIADSCGRAPRTSNTTERGKLKAWLFNEEGKSPPGNTLPGTAVSEEMKGLDGSIVPNLRRGQVSQYPGRDGR